MSYKVVWSRRSRKDLEGMDSKTRSRIIEKVESIKDSPFQYVKRLMGVPLYRLRMGKYRVILDIKNNELLIFVVMVGKRENIYSRF